MDDAVQPAETEVQAPILWQVCTQPNRSLPVVIAIALCCSAPIVDRRKACRIQTRDRSGKINGPFFPGQAASFSNRVERSVFGKCGHIGFVSSALCRDIDHTTHRIRSPEHALATAQDFNPFDVVGRQVGKIEGPNGGAVDDRAIDQDKRLLRCSSTHPYIDRGAKSSTLKDSKSRRPSKRFCNRPDFPLL